MFVDSVNIRCILSFSCLICATVISCAPLFDTNINLLLWHIFRFDGLCFRSCLRLGLKTFLSLCVALNRNWLYCTGVHANMGTHKYRRSALSGQRLYSVVKVTAKQGQTQWSEETQACPLFILPQAIHRKKQLAAANVRLVCVRSHCHSVFPPALKKILPTAPFSAGGSVGRCEEEKT